MLLIQFKCPDNVTWSNMVYLGSIFHDELHVVENRPLSYQNTPTHPFLSFFCRLSFSQTHNIANFVSLHICSLLRYLHHMILINVKLNVTGYQRIPFQGCRFHESSSFLMAQLKWSWQYWAIFVENSFGWSQREFVFETNGISTCLFAENKTKLFSLFPHIS